jgi:hypothetical protein
VAVDDQHVYWTTGSTIGRANLDGSAPDPSFIAGADAPRGVAVDDQHVYWANYSVGIGRANLDGSAPNPSFIAGDSPYAVAVDGQHVYWVNYATNMVGRANLDGSAPNPSFIPGAGYPLGVAVDDQHVYWANFASDTIGRASLDGSLANQGFITGASDPSGVAVDAATQSPLDTEITRTKIHGHKAKFKFTGSGGSAPLKFQCKLTHQSRGLKRWKSCSSPQTYQDLKRGKHTFKVRAIDSRGELDPTPAKHRFEIG